MAYLLVKAIQITAWMLVAAAAYDVIRYAKRGLLRAADRAFVHRGSHAIRALIEWHGVYRAYGFRSFYAVPLVTVVFHVSFAGLLACHAPCILSVICAERPAPPMPGVLETILAGVALCSRITLLAWRLAVAEVREAFLAALRVEGVSTMTRILSFEAALLTVLGLGLMWRVLGVELHLYACLVCLALVILSPSVRHSLIYSWARPLVLTIKALRSARTHE